VWWCIAAVETNTAKVITVKIAVKTRQRAMANVLRADGEHVGRWLEWLRFTDMVYGLVCLANFGQL
jgi:hypothetical protein